MSEIQSALHRIAAERLKLALILSALMLIFYFGFIFLVAFDKGLLGMLLSPGLSLGILLGALVIVSAWVLCLIYVQWANNHYDRIVAEAAAELGRK